jgi:hypothetical protein
VKDGRIHYDYNFFGRATYSVTSNEPLPTGDVEIVLNYEQQPFRQFAETKGGAAELFVNGKSVGRGNIDNAVVGRFSATETLDVGMDLGAAASAAYHEQLPFAFTGIVKSVEIEISPTQPLITEKK